MRSNCKLYFSGTLLAYTIVSVSVIILRFRPKSDTSNGQYMALSSKNLLDDTSDSEEELVYCSDKNPVLPTNDPPLPEKSPNPRSVLFCPWQYDQATPTSASVANALTLTSSFLSFLLAILLIHSESHTLLISFLLVLICFVTFWTRLLPMDEQNLAFKVPFVPFLPNLSIFINLYLMLKLSPATWVRFTVWMIIGLTIYVKNLVLH